MTVSHLRWKFQRSQILLRALMSRNIAIIVRPHILQIYTADLQSQLQMLLTCSHQTVLFVSLFQAENHSTFLIHIKVTLGWPMMRQLICARDCSSSCSASISTTRGSPREALRGCSCSPTPSETARRAPFRGNWKRASHWQTESRPSANSAEGRSSGQVQTLQPCLH